MERRGKGMLVITGGGRGDVALLKQRSGKALH